MSGHGDQLCQRGFAARCSKTQRRCRPVSWALAIEAQDGGNRLSTSGNSTIPAGLLLPRSTTAKFRSICTASQRAAAHSLSNPDQPEQCRASGDSPVRDLPPLGVNLDQPLSTPALPCQTQQKPQQIRNSVHKRKRQQEGSSEQRRNRSAKRRNSGSSAVGAGPHTATRRHTEERTSSHQNAPPAHGSAPCRRAPPPRCTSSPTDRWTACQRTPLERDHPSPPWVPAPHWRSFIMSRAVFSLGGPLHPRPPHARRHQEVPLGHHQQGARQPGRHLTFAYFHCEFSTEDLSASRRRWRRVRQLRTLRP